MDGGRCNVVLPTVNDSSLQWIIPRREDDVVAMDPSPFRGRRGQRLWSSWSFRGVLPDIHQLANQLRSAGPLKQHLHDSKPEQREEISEERTLNHGFVHLVLNLGVAIHDDRQEEIQLNKKNDQRINHEIRVVENEIRRRQRAELWIGGRTEREITDDHLELGTH